MFNLSLTDSADLSSERMPMMMWVLDLGLSGLMSNMLMKGSFAAHPGPQVSIPLSLPLIMIITVCWLLVCFPSLIYFLKVTDDNLLFPRSYMCWRLIWFSLVLFGERINRVLFEDTITIHHSTSLTYLRFASRGIVVLEECWFWASSTSDTWNLMKMASFNTGTEYG